MTRLSLLVAGGIAATALAVVPAQPASAAGSLSVSKTQGLDPAGETVTVSGQGHTAGIYVAFCVDNGPGVKPSPCMGGADTSGSSGGSHWITDTPPSYAGGLTTPFGPGGSFSVSMRLTATDATLGTDCRVVQCSVVVRYDHTNPEDRSGDVLVPVSFRDSTASSTPAPVPAPVAPQPAATTKPLNAPTPAVQPTAPSASAAPTSTPTPSATPSASSSATSSSARPSASEDADNDASPAASRSDAEGGIPIWLGVAGGLVLATAGSSAWFALRRRAS